MASAIGVPLTGTQSLGLKSGQVMLETEEMSWLLIFMQLKKVHLSLGFFSMSPGCGHNTVRTRLSECPSRGQPRKMWGVQLHRQEAGPRSRVTGQVTPIRVLETGTYLLVVANHKNL